MPTRRKFKKIGPPQIALGVRFRKPLLLAAALTHPSYRNEAPCPKLDNFDRLEFFGDSILNFVVCRKLYRHFPGADEGHLSRLRSTLVSRRILARIAKELRLWPVILIGKSLRKQAQHSQAKILADTFEAIIAAIYLDQGLPKAERFILKHFADYFDAKRLMRLDPNPKSTLQELCQKTWQELPQYENSSGSRGFKTEVRIGRGMRAHAWGKSRRGSEEKAARSLIQKIRQSRLRKSKKAASSRK